MRDKRIVPASLLTSCYMKALFELNYCFTMTKRKTECHSPVYDAYSKQMCDFLCSVLHRHYRQLHVYIYHNGTKITGYKTLDGLVQMVALQKTSPILKTGSGFTL